MPKSREDFLTLDDEQVEVLLRVLKGRDIGLPRACLEPLVAAGYLEPHEEVIGGEKTDSGVDVRVTRYRFRGDVTAMRFERWVEEDLARRFARPTYELAAGALKAGAPSAAAQARIALVEAAAAARAQDDAGETPDWMAVERLRRAWAHAALAEEGLPPPERMDLSELVSYRTVCAEAYAIRRNTVEIHRSALRSLVEECLAVRGAATNC